MPTPLQRIVSKAQPRAHDGLSIADTAERIGISAAALRVWESRYGWPRPKRSPNGYRWYPATLVAILERVSAELSLGKTIGDLMRDPWVAAGFRVWSSPFTPATCPG